MRRSIPLMMMYDIQYVWSQQLVGLAQHKDWEQGEAASLDLYNGNKIFL